jgi:cobalt-factor III methyltransferase
MIVAVGIGPGSEDLLTGEARRALLQADVIVGYKPYLALIKGLIEGKTVEGSGMRQEVDRCRRALALSRQGLRVAVVSSGDAGVYGMAGLLIELDPEAEIEVVPGITACQAAAARLGAPLMNDFAVLSLSDLLTPRAEVLRRVTAVAAADLVTCLYNPTSRRRRPLFEQAVGIFLEHRRSDTPVGWVKNAYREGEEVHLTSLGDLVGEPVDMWSVVLVGSSRTELLAGRLVTRRGYREKYGDGGEGAVDAGAEGDGLGDGLRETPGNGRRVYLLGGTGYSRELCATLEERGYPVRLSVATPLGAAEVGRPPSGGIQTGRLDVAGLLREISEWRAAALVDATHPFAVEVSAAARAAAEAAGIPAVRATRPAWVQPEVGATVEHFETAEELAAELARTREKALLTVGAKGLSAFAGRGLALSARVLPTPESVQAALDAGIAPADIIAAYPPHGADFTAACVARCGATVIVSKESGSEGGLDEKLQAAVATGARLLVIGRPPESGESAPDPAALLQRLEEIWKEY